ncbi:MAG TPA: response regulator transcription factor [Caldilineaceae bacterium]|nr:response regulator transcription factor [Caldilineaceae bacterium]
MSETVHLTPKASKTILVVDDDRLMRRSLSATLGQAGYIALTAGSAEDALEAVRVQRPDLVLLDIGLPGMDGLEAIRSLRQVAPRLPVIFVTARRRELDEIVGLELGADDYITKPFDMDVLLAHVRAVLRRSHSAANDGASAPVTVGDLEIDPAAREARLAGRRLDLAPKEFDLLLLLARHAGRVLSPGEILETVWGPEWAGENQTLYVHVRWLREKIEEDPAHPRRLLTVRGSGYKLVAG